VAIRERLDGLSRAELTGLIVVLVLALGGAGLWYVRSLPRPIQVAASRPATTGASGATGAASASPSATPVIVDVAGWVRSPGVYAFADGDRIVDAIERAGGARHGAYLAALNLAAPLVDGTQILVPREGAAPAPGGTGSTTTGAAGGLVNINTASATELEALPGIGEVLAATIVAYRDEHGPFASVDQLEDVSGIGPSTLEDIRDLVTV
jgi:competence protein ComEA